MRNQEHLDIRIKEIRQLLSHLHGEITALEAGVVKVLLDLNTDSLTGLKNRRAIENRINEVLDYTHNERINVGVIMIDIDNFKQINDQWGHPVGDEVLSRIGSLLKSFENQNCSVGRWGGEEFIIIAVGSETEVKVLSEFIRRGVENLAPLNTSSLSLRATVSIGTAHSNRFGYVTDELIKKADEALYKAKRTGKNRVEAA